MEELVSAIEKLAEKSTFDYIIIIAPILLSIIAIGISIFTAHRQNKIALFEKRYEVISEVKSILAFAKTVSDYKDKRKILIFFDSFFGTQVSDLLEGDKDLYVPSIIGKLRYDLSQAQFLFSLDNDEELQNIITFLGEFLSAMVLGHEFITKRDGFCSCCSNFYNSTFKDMAREIKIR